MSEKMTVEEYIESFDGTSKAKLLEMREIIHPLLPDAEECISYGMPTYRQKKNLVHFAVFKKHIGFYPTPGVIEAFSQELTGYRTSKGAIQFPLNEPLPIKLIVDMVKYRKQQENIK